MAYAHGTKWTESMVIDRLNEVVEEKNLDHFPTHSELIDYYNNNALASKLAKSGGTKYWSNKLGMKQVSCESKFGDKYEEYCMEQLEKLGYECEKMKPRYPYDLTANKHIKIDVKSARLFTSVTNSNSKYYTFNLEKTNPTCDIFICYCLDENNKLAKIYIIPSVELYGKTQLSLGVYKSKYDKFINRWDIFDFYDSFYKKSIALGE